MLELKNISKTYESKDLTQVALKNVNISFRKSEFVSILGPSGSGKTTLLNIIGGLDKYTSGDLLINNVSTKKYKDKDWDTYRNHKIGFIFQSYNLISHQTILANVELALTLSGISKKERRKRCIKALTEVGLEKHLKKKPNMLSGGQMQRVAIARALVNNPDIVLADEPTGALDSKTSTQIMDILKSVAKDRLVIMVTHNKELAEKYSSRIISIKDGNIENDTNPFDLKTNDEKIDKKHKKNNKSMTFLTALSLSLNNLMTKKARTFLTSFAGSIGIIGIALILSLSAGATNYINRTEKETLSSYPIMIEANSINYSQMLNNSKKSDDEKVKCTNNSVCTLDDVSINPYLQLSNLEVTNNLKVFKNALEENYENINDYVMDIKYNYDLDLQIYNAKNNEKISNYGLFVESMQNMYNASSSSSMSNFDTTFKELLSDSDLLKSQYDLVYGKYPEQYNELVLVTDKDGKIPLSLIYTLGIKDKKELNELLKENKSIASTNYTYESFLSLDLKLVKNYENYQKEGSLWINKTYDEKYLDKIISSSENIKIVGILKVKSDAINAQSGFIGYTKDLSNYLIKENNSSKIAKEQKESKNKSVLTGQSFDEENTYEDTLKIIGASDLSSPSLISIYPKNFDDKEKVTEIIKKYNDSVEKENQINYTDYVKILMSGITTIIDVITYILIAFVAISLVVSSIMIAIITYISVLERTKEIGILRAIGASKKDISRVFNAETIIEGFMSGTFGILVTLLLNKVVDKIVYSLANVKNITHLTVQNALILIVISVILTFIAGLIPSKIASKKDPVVSLRSE